MVLIMAFNFLVGFTDIYVAGLINPEVQAAIGFIGQLYFLIIIIANAISIGTLAMVSRAFGAGDLKKTVGIARQALLFSILAAIGLTVFGLFFSRAILTIAGIPDEIKDMAEKFFRIFAFALGPNYILIISNAVFRAVGDMKKPLFTMFLVSAINVAGDFLLVFGVFGFDGLGYVGIAVSTALSMTIGTLINLGFFFSGRWRDIYRGPLKISADAVKKITELGWPAVLLQIAWSAGSIVLYNILGRLGDKSITAIASISNGLRIEAVIYLPAFALNMAAAVLVGQNLGAGNSDRAEKAVWKIASIGVAFVSLISLPVFLWAEHFASFLTKDPAVLEETARYLRINMLSEPFMALGAILSGGLQGAGDTKRTMHVIVIAMWLVRLPLAYYLALVLNYGATGVWVAMITSMSLQGMLMAWKFRQGRWKKLKVY